jgi:hypothetical protein
LERLKETEATKRTVTNIICIWVPPRKLDAASAAAFIIGESGQALDECILQNLNLLGFALMDVRWRAKASRAASTLV